MVVNGDDHLIGSAGNDVMVGRPGSDYFDRGDGFDTVMDYRPKSGRCCIK